MTEHDHRDFRRAMLRAKLIRDDNLLQVIVGHGLDFVGSLDAAGTYRVSVGGIYGEGRTLDRAAADALSKILLPEVES